MSDILFPDTEVKLEDLFLDIKYDGPSFDGVMNIKDLGNELLGVEYCLTKIIKDLIQSSNELNQSDIDSLQILTEGFVNNCFKKKIKFFLESLNDNLVSRPIIKSIIKSGIDVYLYSQTIQSDINKVDTKSMLESSQIPEEQYRQIRNLPIPDNAKKVIENNILDKKYREESLKIILPIKDDKDTLQSSSPILNKNVVINKENKGGFFVTGLNDEIDGSEIEENRNIEGRISSINLDATKNQIGFKVNDQGNKIDCHLPENLDINDYKAGYLGEWVKINGKVSYSGETIKEIEILKLEKATRHGQMSIPLGGITND